MTYGEIEGSKPRKLTFERSTPDIIDFSLKTGDIGAKPRAALSVTESVNRYTNRLVEIAKAKNTRPIESRSHRLSTGMRANTHFMKNYS